MSEGSAGASYELYGLRVDSRIPLPAPSLSGGASDLRVELGEPAEVPQERPDGEAVAELAEGGVLYYSFCRGGSGYLARFYRAADVDISADLTSIRCRPDPRCNPGLMPLLIVGTLMAFVLQQAGRMVLHASAVGLDGDAFAFVAPSGGGKSTLATLACAAGATLVTDDVLVVDPGEDGPRCRQGTGEVRLRPPAAFLAEQLGPDVVTRWTVDERLAVRAPLAEAMPRLAAVVLPQLDRTGAGLAIERVTPGRATFALAAGQRIAGWHAPADVRRNFTLAAELARTVPVLDMRVPWGPPWRDDLGANILDTLRQSIPVRRG